LRNQIPSRVEAFIEETVHTARKICGDHFLSLYLFGGLVYGEFKETSDVDLLFIIDDKCSDEIKSKLEKALETVEIRHGFLKTDKENALFCIFAYRTALFKSHFVVRLKSLREMNFKSLFIEGKGFDLPFGTTLFPIGPSRLVIRNILAGGRIVYGIDVINTIAMPKLSSSDFNKSLVMSLFMSMFGVLFSFISKSGTRFSLEAFKWYIINAHSFLTNEPSNARLAESFIRLQVGQRIFLLRFSELRKNYSRDLVFALFCPLYIIHLHSKLIRNIAR
jgi:predicted nucleotidyltransferase